MPRDLPLSKFETKPIDRLITELRGPEPAWWNFGCGDHCAIEVAARIGLGTNFTDQAKALGMSHEDFNIIFAVDYNCERPQLVRARHVAEALEYFKQNGRARSPERFMCNGRALNR
jgi:hypothetical protein